MEKIKIKQVRSRIGRPKDQKRTLDALGLRKMNAVVEHNATPQILGMVKKISHLIKNKRFMLTYGDGLADININKLLKFHKQHGKIGTITTVHPNARFGELNLNGNIVTQLLTHFFVNNGNIFNNNNRIQDFDYLNFTFFGFFTE